MTSRQAWFGKSSLFMGILFLQGFYFPFADPHVFSDLIPYHLLPQLFSGYSPVALALSAYIIFVVIILIFSVLVYNMTKNITSSLIFASLLVNIPNFAADNFFLRPEVHMGAITFFRSSFANLPTEYSWKIECCSLLTYFSSYQFFGFSYPFMVFRSAFCY